MKLLIAYEESTYSDAAISDLYRAGLPKDTDAIVLSVVQQKPVSQPSSLALFGVSAAAAPAMLPDYEGQLVEEARKQALSVTEALQSRFPSWRVSTQVRLGYPVNQILAAAEELRPDLIVVGSRGRSALGRLLLGSVSYDIVKHAPCSVRVGREPRANGSRPVRLVIGVDGSPGSDAAVKVVAERRWPKRSEALVLAALNL